MVLPEQQRGAVNTRKRTYDRTAGRQRISQHPATIDGASQLPQFSSTCASARCMPGVYNPHLTRINGVVTSAGDDWSLSEVVWVFTVATFFWAWQRHSRANGWTSRSANGWRGLSLLLGRRLSYRCSRHHDPSAVVALSGLRGNWRLRLGLGQYSPVVL